MKRGAILNSGLINAIGCMGHTDLMMICDAGYPIPIDAWKVDLALTKDDPDIYKILTLIEKDLVVEKVIFAEEQEKYNSPLSSKVKNLFNYAELEKVPHTEVMTTLRAKVKIFIRSGSFEPWGNVILQSGVDAPQWFDKPGTVAPDFYQSRIENLNSRDD
ncbi:MAG: D-ribose pyranase [Flexilinea sp.]